jgi:epsin
MRSVWSVIGSPDARTWRQTYKGLQLLDILVRNGSERVIDDVRSHMFRIKALQNFEHSENNRDQGAGIREEAKKLVALLGDTAALRDERRKARDMAGKVIGMSNDGSTIGAAGGGGGSASMSSSFHDESPRRGGGGNNDNAWAVRGGVHDTSGDDDDYASSSGGGNLDHYVPKATTSDFGARHAARAAGRKGRAHASSEASASVPDNAADDFFSDATFASAPPPQPQSRAAPATDDFDFGLPVLAPSVAAASAPTRPQVTIRPIAAPAAAPDAAHSFDPFVSAPPARPAAPPAEIDFFSTPSIAAAPAASAAAAFDPFGMSSAPAVSGNANPFAMPSRIAPALASPSSDFGSFASAAPAGSLDSDLDRLVALDKLSIKSGGE